VNNQTFLCVTLLYLGSTFYLLYYVYCSVTLFCLGVLLPGDVTKFPFIFKSPNAGIFSEQWEFQTHPVVCGGAKLLVTLRGVALKQDKHEEQCSELEVRICAIHCVCD